jgi:hypothetical protein
MRRLAVPWLILSGVAGLFVACYGRAIFRGEQFAYRDASYYYYPLHQRVQAEWDAGRWPLWEPEENSGMPLLGNPTAAVLYPGKLVFALVPYPLAARLYIMGHTLLAFAAMLALLRHGGTSWVGSALGALAYAFGGPVLFQYCNIIYLVGAAWLPLGFRAVDRWVRLGRRIALAELAVVLAMETLGGDPESAYLTGLCAVVYAAGLAGLRRARVAAGEERQTRPARRVALLLGLWVLATLIAAAGAPFVRPVGPANHPQPTFPWTPWVGTAVVLAWGLAGLALLARWRKAKAAGARPVLAPWLAGLVVAAVVAAATSAAQLVPVLEFIAQSERAAEDGPHDVYPFSIQPFRIVELVWPNCFGTVYHGNKLWLGALPPRQVNVNVWVPTLYLGGLTLVFALGGWRPRTEGSSAPGRGWLGALVVLSLLGSFGSFGSPIWLARTIPGTERLIGPHDPSDLASYRAFRFLRDGDGGLYWLLATGLPGFGQFRYPGKLLTFTALGVALLSGQGWDALASGDPRVRRRTAAWSGALLALTLAALAFSVARRGAILAWLEAQKLTSMFGLFDAPGALGETQSGLVQAAVVLSFALLLTLRLAGRHPTTAAVLALAVTSVDLALANARMILTVPQAVMDSKPEVISILERAEKERPGAGPYRVHRVPVWSPIGWGETASSDRMLEIVAWARQTAEAKYGINFGVHYTQTAGVTELYDYRWFFGGFFYGAREKAARILRVERGTPVLAFSRRAFDMWNTRYFILPEYPVWDDGFRGIASFIERTERIVPPPDAFTGPDGKDQAAAWVRTHDYQIRRNLNAYPRAWVVHDSRSAPAFRGLGRAERDLPMQEILFSNDMSWPDPARIAYDPRRYVWLEDSVRGELAAYLSGDSPSTGETVRVVEAAPDRVELAAVLERPGIVVLADVYYPGWRLTIDGQAAPIYRANRMMRGAAVDTGSHRLVYTYHPASFRIGLVVSGIGLGALGGLVVWSAFPGRSARGALAPRHPDQ